MRNDELLGRIAQARPESLELLRRRRPDAAASTTRPPTGPTCRCASAALLRDAAQPDFAGRPMHAAAEDDVRAGQQRRRRRAAAAGARGHAGVPRLQRQPCAAGGRRRRAGLAPRAGHHTGAAPVAALRGAEHERRDDGAAEPARPAEQPAHAAATRRGRCAPGARRRGAAQRGRGTMRSGSRPCCTTTTFGGPLAGMEPAQRLRPPDPPRRRIRRAHEPRRGRQALSATAAAKAPTSTNRASPTRPARRSSRRWVSIRPARWSSWPTARLLWRCCAAASAPTRPRWPASSTRPAPAARRRAPDPHARPCGDGRRGAARGEGAAQPAAAAADDLTPPFARCSKPCVASGGLRHLKPVEGSARTGSRSGRLQPPNRLAPQQRGW